MGDDKKLIRFHLVRKEEKASTVKRSGKLLFFSIVVLVVIVGLSVLGYAMIERLETGIVEEKPPDIPKTEDTPPPEPAPDRRKEDPLLELAKHGTDSLHVSPDSTQKGPRTRVNEYILRTRDGWHMLLGSVIDANLNVDMIVAAEGTKLYLNGRSESEPVYLKDMEELGEGLIDHRLLWSDLNTGKYRWVTEGFLYTKAEIDTTELRRVLPFQQGPIRAWVDSTADKNDLESYDIRSIGKDQFPWGARYLFQARFKGTLSELQNTLEDLADTDRMFTVYSAGIEIHPGDERMYKRDIDANFIFALFNPNPDPEPEPQTDKEQQ